MPAKSLFPAVALEDAEEIAKVIADKNAGQPMRRLDIFEELHRSPDSGPSRTMVTASSGFGLTIGSYKAEYLSLTTELGRRLAVDGDPTAKIDALLNVEVFKTFFDTYKDSVLPSEVAARSFLANRGIAPDRTEACFELIQTNGRYCGLIGQIGSSERVLSREHAIERTGAEPAAQPATPAATPSPTPAPVSPPAPAGLPSLNVNLEIHLPSDATAETYDAIFSSMRKHLIDGR